MELKFYICPICGNITVKLKDSGVPLVCCGKPMEVLVANTTEAAQEKHLPVVSVENGVALVKVGSIPHPQTAEHFIEFIVLSTTSGFRVCHLKPDGKAPSATFALSAGEKVTAAFAYCNLHSLWKTEV